MRKFILWVAAAIAVTGCAPKSMTYDEAMTKLNTGGHALIYGGSYQVATSLIGSARTLTPGKFTLGNEYSNLAYADRTRFIDSTGNAGYWGSTLVPAGTWRVHKIDYVSGVSYLGSYVQTDTFGFPEETTITVAPGEVVYIGQLEVAAPSLSAIFSTRTAIRRDNFAKFRDELRTANPDLAQRAVYRPLQSRVIVEPK
jgi:hypothetical protein